MAGKLYGVGVGPGDPELLTQKAIRIMKECDAIAVPGKIPEETVAYQIAKAALPELTKKESVGIYMPMTKDPEALAKWHEAGVQKLCAKLDEERQIAFLTLGDPTVYSTYLYLQEQIAGRGYETEIISGIPSFCAAAARMCRGIAKKEEQIHIIPASYQIAEALKLPGTKVLMKAGRNFAEVKRQLETQDAEVWMVENCGMETERIYEGIEKLPEEAGYYTLLFVKGKGETR